MKKVKLKDLFYIKHGTKLDFTDCNVSEESTIAYISRDSKNSGFQAFVDKVDSLEPLVSGSITVSLGGSYLLSAFVQPVGFYTSQNVKILTPKEEMGLREKIYYCLCISANRFRYQSHGREANKTLDAVEVPSRDSIPQWVYEATLPQIDATPLASVAMPMELNTKAWKSFKLIELFEMFAGKYFPKDSYEKGIIPYISATDINNGVKERISKEAMFEGNTITIGKVVPTIFYQSLPFSATADVTVLQPKKITPFNQYIGMFFVTVISLEKNKWSYGRQIRLNDCQQLVIRLPTTSQGSPDWQFMENYIKSLPYSSQL